MTEAALPLTLLMIGLMALASRRWRVVGVSLILVANWAFCDAVVHLTGNDYPVIAFIAADYLAARAVFAIRASHWQSAIMAIYAVQIICHGAYSLSDMGVAPTYYSYWALTYVAWAQIFLLGSWLGHDAINAWLSLPRGRHIETVFEPMAQESRK